MRIAVDRNNLIFMNCASKWATILLKLRINFDYYTLYPLFYCQFSIIKSHKKTSRLLAFFLLLLLLFRSLHNERGGWNACRRRHRRDSCAPRKCLCSFRSQSCIRDKICVNDAISCEAVCTVAISIKSVNKATAMATATTNSNSNITSNANVALLTLNLYWSLPRTLQQQQEHHQHHHSCYCVDFCYFSAVSHENSLKNKDNVGNKIRKIEICAREKVEHQFIYLWAKYRTVSECTLYIVQEYTSASGRKKNQRKTLMTSISQSIAKQAINKMLYAWKCKQDNTHSHQHNGYSFARISLSEKVKTIYLICNFCYAFYTARKLLILSDANAMKSKCCD